MGRKARQAMDKEQKRAAKAHFVAQIQAGQPWYVAAARAGLPINRSTAYRLLQVYASQGEAALQDGRHGHSSKLRGDARTDLARLLPARSLDAEFRDPNAAPGAVWRKREY